LVIIGLLWILFASVQDIKSREVSNWLNFSLIIFALGIRFFYSLFEAGHFMVFYQGLIGLGIFLVLGNLFYYARLFGGGDAKLMIALGAVLPFGLIFSVNLNIFIWFLALFLLVGAVYGSVWSVVLMIINFKKFKLEFSKLFYENKKLVFIVMIFGILIIGLGIYDLLFSFLGCMVLFLPFLYIYAKSVDESCMVKKVLVKNLTEGDLLYRDVLVGTKKVEASWEGLDASEIKKIRKFKKFVLIRQGIPFVPVFLISYLVLVYFYFTGFLFSFGF